MRLRLLVALFTAAALLSGCVTVAPFGGSGNNKLKATTVRGEGDAAILWLSINGMISGRPQSQAFGLVHEPSVLARVRSVLNKAKHNDDLVAVILRINSPGGTVAASDAIYARIMRFKKNNDVPVIASYGALAASGAYYLSMAADYIIAQPTTITGSIGVILLSFDATGLLHKLGIKNKTYRSRPNKDILSPLDSDTPQQRQIIKQVIDHLYQRFVYVVRSNRDLKQSELNRITDGRIFTANQALNLGLIDAIGRIPDAIRVAKQRAGVEHARIIRYYRGAQPPRNLYMQASAGAVRPAAAQINILPIDLGLDALGGPQLLYMWEPGQ